MDLEVKSVNENIDPKQFLDKSLNYVSDYLYED